ncbi:MAG: tyrosine-type recombinase/integrase, partial [Candidatus Binatia bacterium]|nr:tyrosine-type recombinase/integrase [Candidatus Binatia bacterium]
SLYADEEARLLEAAAESNCAPMYTLIILWLDTGMRCSELLGLRRTDLSKVEDDGETFTVATVWEGKTENSKRRIVLGREANAVLNIWLARFPDAPANGCLFPSTRNGTGSETKWDKPMCRPGREWNKVVKAAGLDSLQEKRGKQLVIHDLRHTAITREDKITSIPKSVSLAKFGHSTVLEAARYTHNHDNDRIAALRAREAETTPQARRLRAV